VVDQWPAFGNCHQRLALSSQVALSVSGIKAHESERGSCGWFNLKPEPRAFERFRQIVNSGAGFGLRMENHSFFAWANHVGSTPRQREPQFETTWADRLNDEVVAHAVILGYYRLARSFGGAITPAQS